MQLLNRRNRHNNSSLYSEQTEPGLSRFTQPLPEYELPSYGRIPWQRRLASGLQQTLIFVVRKMIFLFNFALSLLLLLLLTRFVLTAFSLHTSIFADWVFQLSDLPVHIFTNLIPAVHYQGLLLDMNTLVAMLFYLLIVKLFVGLLRNLFIPPRSKWN
jgi:hypothetical protein